MTRRRPTSTSRAARRSARRGISLIELMVVVAIIAALLAILLPSLKNAREAAKVAKCQANLRSYGQGNKMYMTDSTNWYVPINHPYAKDTTGSWGVRWMQNRLYMDIMNAKMGDKWVGESEWDDGLLCPSMPPRTDDALHPYVDQWRVYAFNHEGVQWVGPSNGDGYLGVNRFDLEQPSRTIMMVDASDWHTIKSRANYVLWWDRFGDNYGTIGGTGVWSEVAYRHQERVNTINFDLSTHLLTKDEAWPADTQAKSLLWDVVRP
ncbi:MAG: prepilin-type N-terminal cleavage/methylation domain-containing protein [Phycisphaera sp.]|nr:prepilin-type N-terminal cleavage/methylation domain-containing protein [Phycisphaera sp.]